MPPITTRHRIAMLREKLLRVPDKVSNRDILDEVGVCEEIN